MDKYAQILRNKAVNPEGFGVCVMVGEAIESP